MKKLVHRKGLVKQVCRIAGRIGRSWKATTRAGAPLKGIRSAAWAPKAV